MTDSTPPVRLRDDADFRRYWVARSVSLGGSIITLVAMPVLVYRLTHSTGLTALTATLDALPYLLVGLVAGALSDRWDRKRVMVTADLANVVVLGSVPVAHWLGVLTVAHVLVAGFVGQTLFTFFDGANFGALPVLVGRDLVGPANAAVWGVGGVLDLTMPALAGISLAIVHPATLLAVDAVSFLVSALLVRAIGRALSSDRSHLPPLQPATLLADVREGLQFLWRNDGVRANTIIGTLQSIAGAGCIALFVPWSDQVLQIGTSGWRFGLLYAVWGIGGLVASAASPRLFAIATPAQLTLWSVPASGLAGLCVALTRSWVLATLLMVLWGIGYQLVILTSITFRQQVTPEHLLGRVNTAGRMLSWGLGWTVGSIVAGALATRFGVRPALIGMVSVGLVAAVYAWCSPLRRADVVAVVA